MPASASLGKIAYVFAELDRPVYGPSGHSIHIHELCQALRDSGANVVIIAASAGAHGLDAIRVCELAPRLVSLRRRVSRSNTDAPTDLPDGQATPSRTASASPMRFWRDAARVATWRSWDSYFYRKARQAVLRERPDFLYERYVRGISVGARLAHEFDLPFILEMNTSFTFPIEWWDEHSALLPWAVARVERYNTTAADKVVVVSSHLRDYLRDRGVPPDKLVLTFNAADVRRFPSARSDVEEIRARQNLRGALVVGFVGSLKRWHGVDVLVSAFPQCLAERPDMRLLIVGDGPLRHHLEALAKREGVMEHVTFTGNVAHAEIPAYISAMDIAVCPAPAIPGHHLSPLKLFEYMAAARPIVAARFSDVPSIVQDAQNGILVAPGNTGELAAAILQLARDPDLRKRLGDAARRTVNEGQTWAHNAEKVVALFEEIARTKAAGRSKPCRSAGGAV
jgi:glycosyltransferase involved in cell wall biosynthesis